MIHGVLFHDKSFTLLQHKSEWIGIFLIAAAICLHVLCHLLCVMHRRTEDILRGTEGQLSATSAFAGLMGFHEIWVLECCRVLVPRGHWLYKN